MLPRRSSNNSQRRSSILKPPKSRQPFQDLDFNTSSPEISPESTKRRRVSFAEKKHVKEFCDHKEQGTIWDSTYEEADHDVSRSIEASAENASQINTENIKIVRNEAGFDFLQGIQHQNLTNSEKSADMDQNEVGNSSETRLFNSEVDLDLTDVIPSSQITPNYLMSQTIICQDNELDITKPIGGIEPTISVRKILDSRQLDILERSSLSIAKEIANAGKSIVFDDSGGEMMFTEVISGRTDQTLIPPNVDMPQELGETNSVIENQTIIFEDSIMDLTLTKSQVDLELDPSRTIENIFPRAAGTNTQSKKSNLYNTGDQHHCESTQNSNKTILFNDISCEMTEVVDTIMQKVPHISLENKENIPVDRLGVRNSSVEICPKPVAIEVNALSNGSDFRIANCDTHGDKTIFFNDIGCEITEAVDTVMRMVPQINPEDKENNPEVLVDVRNKSVDICAESAANGDNNLSDRSNFMTTNSDTHGNKTIFSSDIGCEMTEAVETFRSRPALVENVNRGDAEQTVPQEMFGTNLIPESVEIEIQPCKSQSISSRNKTDAESSPKLISQYNDRTEYFNDSVMEFTVAIGREKNNENVEVAKNCAPESNKTVIFDNCNVEITAAVKTPLCILNFESNSEEINKDLPNTEIDSAESQNNNKRKSDEIEVNVDHSKTANSLMHKSTEHDVVQSLVYDESNHCVTDVNLSKTFTRNCKRFKVSDINAQEKSNLGSKNDLLSVEMEVREKVTKKTIGFSSSLNTPEIPQLPIQVLEGVETVSDPVTNSLEQDVRNAGKSGEDTVSNYCNYQERLVIDDSEKNEVVELLKLDENDVNEEECSFGDAALEQSNSDSDYEAETLQLSHVFMRQNQSTLEKSIKAEIHLETNENLDYNDDCCFVMFSEELEKHAKRDDCIWTIRSLDTEKVVINFISKSLIVVIHLEVTEKLTTPRMIKDIRIISLLGDSAADDISMIHNILLKKLDPKNLKLFHRTTQDVLPMLEVISRKVKLLLDFMYEFDKLQDLHLIRKSGNCISFLLHSYKVQLVIKVTVDLERFEEIGPNDVQVECILGNIREKDIKQLITSVKKDHRFLTKYINDIKEYIALVVEK